MSRLADRTVLVTGATGGMGSATVRALAAEGAHVGVADISAELTARLAEEVGGTSLVVDVTSPDSVTAGVEALAAARGT